MATGRRGSIGMGKETTWGTSVAPTSFFNATESITEERGRLREDMVFGTRSRQGADAGRNRFRGGINGMHARAAGVGHWLRAALGAPATSGAAAPYSHVFTPAVAAFSTVAALPPYSVTVKRKSDMIHRYGGGQCSRLTLRQPKDNALVLDSEWLFKGVTSPADTTMVLESTKRFLFAQLAVTRAAAAFPYLEDLAIIIDNGLEPEEVLNESAEISAVEFGANSSITVEMTLTFRDSNVYDDFKNNAVQAWGFLWTIDANTSLNIAIPQLNVEEWGAPISNAGRMTVRVRGTAEYNTAAGHELQVTLRNAEATY
jgi:hypothetical protein